MTAIESIPIGYIFSEARVLAKSAVNNLWVLKANSEKNKLLLSNEYIPHNRVIKRGEILRNLVVIRYGKKVFHVALDNHKENLIRHYFNGGNNSSYMPVKKNWGMIQNKWQNECVANFKDNVIVGDQYKTNDLFLDIFWLRGKDYIVPICGYKDLNLLKGTPLFYPDVFGKKANIGRSVYKTDEIGRFPLMYNANITGQGLTGNTSRDIFLFYHGFTYPAKWHFGIWKHVLALTRFAREKERTFWQKLWNMDFFIENNLFKSCKTIVRKNDEDTCDENVCLSLALFKKIHPEIKGLLHKYLEQFVTSFESCTINKLFIDNGPINTKKIVLKYMKQWAGLYQKTILYGVCHNWDSMATKPVFHVSPVTMFLDEKFDNNWLNKEINENVKGDKIIFDGSLNEIKKCN